MLATGVHKCCEQTLLACFVFYPKKEVFNLISHEMKCKFHLFEEITSHHVSE